MKITTRNAGLLFALSAAGCIAASHPAAAQTFVVGSYDPNYDVAAPFGTAGEFVGYDYQQVYDSTAFATAAGTGLPVTITSLGFSTDGTQGATSETVTFTGLTVKLGYTNQGTVNTGASAGPFTTVFNGNLTANYLANNTFDLVIPTTSLTTFTYDPSVNNLVLDVSYTGETDSPGPGNDFETFEGDSSSATSSYYDQDYGGDPDVAQSDGLVTEFNAPAPAATPEPSSVAGLGFGILALAGLAFTARKRSAGQCNG